MLLTHQLRRSVSTNEAVVLGVVRVALAVALHAALCFQSRAVVGTAVAVLRPFKTRSITFETLFLTGVTVVLTEFRTLVRTGLTVLLRVVRPPGVIALDASKAWTGIQQGFTPTADDCPWT